ncbi:MAG: DUF4338 domain-containing protein [Nitrococcus sp.]|nr:DUF4338 domain-containing protein [Nitrococcus sp.]
MNLREITLDIVPASDEARFRRLLDAHHYLGGLPKIGQSLWYVARWCEAWVALIIFSAPALKCRPRDTWIGWDFRCQYDRLHLLANNSRFLILPGYHQPNLASYLLSRCERRLAQDWPARFGHPLLLLETFVDPTRFRGTIYRAANWQAVGHTRGFRRTQGGYSAVPETPKQVFVRPLVVNARTRLTQALLDPTDSHGGSKRMISADHMRSLPAFFADIPDPRRAQGRRHSLPCVLALATAATLCGMRGYKAIAQWVDDLSQSARARFGCRYRQGRYEVPCTFTIRDVLIRVGPGALDQALKRHNALYAEADEALAIDGKILCNAIDEDGRQTHVMSVVGHQSQTTFAQKKSASCPAQATSKPSRPMKSAPFCR